MIAPGIAQQSFRNASGDTFRNFARNGSEVISGIPPGFFRKVFRDSFGNSTRVCSEKGSEIPQEYHQENIFRSFLGDIFRNYHGNSLKHPFFRAFSRNHFAIPERVLSGISSSMCSPRSSFGILFGNSLRNSFGDFIANFFGEYFNCSEVISGIPPGLPFVNSSGDSSGIPSEIPPRISPGIAQKS